MSKEASALKKTAAVRRHYLLDASSSSNESDSDSGCGIYGRKLNQTKKEIKELHSQKIVVPEGDKSSSEVKVDSSEDEAKELDDSTSDSDSHPSSMKYKKKEKENSPQPPSPPPPPCNAIHKRKTANKQLRELDFVRSMYMSKQNAEVSLVESEVSINENELEKLITVRVSTKEGLKRWEISKVDSFKKIFEELAAVENTNMENIVLMLHERVIAFSDTPNSLNLQIGDIIDCGKVAKPAQERIRVVEGNEEQSESTNPNMISVTLQTEEGRKSRMKFMIAKDETFESILRKYCEKRELVFEDYLLEFDGDKVELSDTPVDLDIDGDEIFDVRKSSKPTLEHVYENKENYEFDDEVICV